MKNGFYFLSVFLSLVTVFFSGCRMPVSRDFSKLPAEDIDVLTVFASDIAILKDRDLLPGSKEKYEAAKRLADGEAELNQKLAEGQAQIDEGWAEIAENRQKLYDARVQLNQGYFELNRQKAEGWSELVKPRMNWTAAGRNWKMHV